MLSLVAIALCQINQSQILIFKGSFDFQICLKLLSMPTTDNFSYKDLTEKIPFLVYFYLGLSDSSFKAIVAK
jgi:hypothetical protein